MEAGLGSIRREICMERAITLMAIHEMTRKKKKFTTTEGREEIKEKEN